MEGNNQIVTQSSIKDKLLGPRRAPLLVHHTESILVPAVLASICTIPGPQNHDKQTSMQVPKGLIGFRTRSGFIRIVGNSSTYFNGNWVMLQPRI